MVKKNGVEERATSSKEPTESTPLVAKVSTHLIALELIPCTMRILVVSSDKTDVLQIDRLIRRIDFHSTVLVWVR